MTQPVVFISYSHKDEQEKEALLTHLGVLQRADLIDLWSDDRIGAGAAWKDEIAQTINRANVAMLLITANFLTSDFILGTEVPALLQRREREGLIVFPVIAKACAWRNVAWLVDMQVRPKNCRPVWRDEGRNADRELAAIAREVAAIVARERGQQVYRDFEYETVLPSPEAVLAHRQALANKAEYRRWADEFYIREESKVLPLLASPYDDDTGQQRQDLLQTIRAHERLLVLGEPGMGKTVAMQRIVWETARSPEPVAPIFVPLLFFQGDLLEQVRVALNETGQLQFDDLPTVRTFLRQVRCLLMFDGLNEVPGQQRERAVKAIADLLREFSGHRYVITSRSQDELWKKLRSSEAIEEAVVIQRITNEQVQTYLAVHLGAERGQELYNQLDERLQGLARTPLLLWLIKEAGLAGETLPGNRGELFDRFVDRILAREEKLETVVPPPEKKQVLADLAFRLQQGHQLACERGQAKAIVAGGSVKHKYNHDPETILNEILLHGLLQGGRQMRFLHQSVQEYFVALALRELVRAERLAPFWQRLPRRLLEHNVAAYAKDDRWTESFVQLAGLIDDPDWLARELVKVHPWLAFWCSIEGQSVDVQTRTIIEAKTIVMLSADKVKQRLQAVQELGRFQNPRTINYLIQVLDDEDEQVRNSVVEILAELGEPAVEPLLDSLHNSEPTRRAATQALGQIWLLPTLTKLGSLEDVTRFWIEEASDQKADVRVVEALIAAFRDSNRYVRRHAAEALGQLGEPAVEPLIAALKDSDPGVRWHVAEALGQLGESAVEPLIAALREDGDSDVRWHAAEALGQLGDARAVWPLISALKDYDGSVRRRATEALGQLGEPAVEPLIAALRDDNREVRSHAVEALDQLRDSRAVEPLIAALGDSDPGVRWGAVEALGRLGEPAVEPLIAVLKDSDTGVRWRAAEALGQLGKPAVEPLIAVLKDSDRVGRWSAVEALGQLGEPAVEPLIAALRDSNRNVQSGAASALGELGDGRAVEPLIAMLSNRDKRVRTSAASALGGLGDDRAVEPLIAALKDNDSDVRSGAAFGLGELGDGRAMEPLIAALSLEFALLKLNR